MAYRRVLPRDLFNEANLLKCLGRLWILLERAESNARFVTEDTDGFDVVQDESSGAIYVRNVLFTVAGKPTLLTRPLNSRGAWPLYAETAEVSVPVFDDEGGLSDEFRVFISLHSEVRP